MAHMQKLMTIIDKNSDRISDGDYLEMCNIMKSMYNVKPKRNPFNTVSLPTVAVPAWNSYVEEFEPYIIRSTDTLDTLCAQLSILATEVGTRYYRLNKLRYRRVVTSAVMSSALTRFVERHNITQNVRHVEDLSRFGYDIDASELYREYLDEYNMNIYERKEALEYEIQMMKISFYTIRMSVIHYRGSVLWSMLPQSVREKFVRVYYYLSEN